MIINDTALGRMTFTWKKSSALSWTLHHAFDMIKEPVVYKYEENASLLSNMINEQINLNTKVSSASATESYNDSNRKFIITISFKNVEDEAEFMLKAS